MKINPQEIKGSWTYGWALDLHTVSSVCTGQDEWGHPIFETIRSEIGEAVYKLKYKDDRSQVDSIAKTMADFIRGNKDLNDVSLIIPTPPSNTTRPFQPVAEIAVAIGVMLRIPVAVDYLHKIRETSVLKNIESTQERCAELKGAFKIADERYRNYHVLIIDDLFRSGETLNAICDALISQGKIGKISVITATITRSRR